MRIRWSPTALNRLAEAAEYIARDKPEAARRWAAGVFQAVEVLSESPRIGRAVPEVGRPEIRELLHGNYRIIYRIGEKAISILTVRHGRRLLDLQELKLD